MGLNRREFLRVSATNAAMVMAISMPTALSAKSKFAGDSNKTQRSHYDTWNVYLTIHPDNQIEIGSPVQDMGQHMKTTGPMLIAEEMDADWNLVSCVAGATYLKVDPKNNSAIYRHANMGTGGSHALRNNWDYLRQAGATAKHMLKQAAAKAWQCDVSDIETKQSYLYRVSTNEKLSFGDVAKIAAELPAPEELQPLKSRNEYSIIGKDATTVDIDQITTGKPLFGFDMDYPNQVHAVIERCPYFDGKIKSYNKEKVLAVEGVLTIVEMAGETDGDRRILSSGIAVIAESLWSALKARRLLQATWYKGPYAEESSQKLAMQGDMFCQSEKSGNILRDDGDLNRGFKSSELILDKTYFTPFFHHACMEPFSCIADVRADGATLVLGHQSPTSAANTVAKLTGLDPLKIDIQAHRMGGGFGRKWMSDFVSEATVLSQKLKAPVKVTWTREDEMQQDYFAPLQVTRIRAGLDKTNKVAAWHYRAAAKRGGVHEKCFPANLIDNYRTETFRQNCGTQVGAWRGPGHLQYTFATESMIDELAYSAEIDPLEFRKALYKDKKSFEYNAYGAEIIDAQRMWKCYEQVANLAEWHKPRAKNIGLGIAGHFTFGSYAAFVLEVEVKPSKSNSTSANFRVTKCWGAIDCGLAVNPNHIRNQMEGGFIDGLNAAMFNQAEISQGIVQTANFDRLPMLRMAQAPLDIEVAILENDYPPTGVGEPPTTPAAAALANAIFAACGQRIRKLPIKLEA